MILTLGSSLPKFKELKFRAGLNVVLSTRAEGSDEGRTRNSAGKSSFVELVHFLLGGPEHERVRLEHRAGLH